MTAVKNCWNCRFSYQQDRDHSTALTVKEQFFDCRRYAPKPMVHGLTEFECQDVPTEWSWPVVSGGDWCGEWETKWRR